MSTNKNEYSPQVVSHPGLTLAEKLQELNIDSKEFAIRVNKPEKTIIEVTKGNISITKEMSIKFESALKIPASFWLSRQRLFDEYQVNIKELKRQVN
ncbi:MAG: hypothetical protein HRT66_06140 [Flavobacteriaceae bacterium]|nr:hypothetical protein [Flavobacteriaceae bacterium]